MTTPAHPFWGPHFPNATHWGPHFPDANSPDASSVGGYGPAGAATFMLDLQSGFKLTLEWVTDIITGDDGKEQRRAIIDAPKQLLSGTAWLLDDDPRTVRARLAQFAAQGLPFLIGLPHEELVLTADASSTTISVGSLTLCDWQQPGQRVIVTDREGTFVSAVIQGVSGTDIELDIAPGDAAPAGGAVMPAMPIYLDPEQGFPRFRNGVEQWNLSARAAIFGFCPTPATLDAASIAGPPPSLTGVTFLSRTPGLAGTDTFLQFQGSTEAKLVDSAAPNHLTRIDFVADTTTVGDVRDLLDLSTWVKMIGGADANVLIEEDAFDGTQFGDGSDVGAWGTGASVTMFDSMPIWDRRLLNPSTMTDSVHALTEMVDLDGIPVPLGTASDPDWGRAVAYTSDSREGWQWLKKFLGAVRGRQQVFWLPTWREDLVWTETASDGSTITVEADDFLVWWPSRRTKIQLFHDDGSIEYATIDSYADNGDGTLTLTLAAAVGTGDVAMVSWLERAHFESDSFEVTWQGDVFSLATTARVVQR